MFKNVFSFRGRIRRLEFALSYLFYLICCCAALVVSDEDDDALIFGIVIIPFYLLLAQGAKRCHDRGNSGFWMLIPFYGLIMLFGQGDPGANEYGDNPKDQRGRVD